mgnify:CR=1 FL=1
MSTQYKASAISSDVYEWGENGEGAHLFRKGGFEVGIFNNVESAIKACKEIIGADYAIVIDGYLQSNVIENGDGYPDGSGNYMVDYVFEIERQEVTNALIDLDEKEF